MPDTVIPYNSDNELGFKNIKIKDIDYVDDYLYVILEDGQKLLLNKKDNRIYDLSDYNHLKNIIEMNNRICAVLTKESAVCVVDLNTMEVLFEDNDALYISKQDERTLHIIKKIGGGNNTIYNIETKKYLPAPENYEFEHSLDNNLYVFCERNSKNPFYEQKRCVINANGIVLLNDIEGWIEFTDNYLIIKKKAELSIIKVTQNTTLDIKTFKKEGSIIANPLYHDGNIIIIEKGSIKIFKPNLELLNEFRIDNLDEIKDLEIVDDTLKLCLPFVSNGKQTNKHLYINLKTGKIISHVRIEGYPYWIPNTYIGFDTLEDGLTDYHFYDATFNKITTITANYYESIDSKKEYIFFIVSKSQNGVKSYLLNTQTKTIKEVNYDIVRYHTVFSYGYGANTSTGKMDFLDEEFNIIFGDLDFKKYDLKLDVGGFGYCIVNDYICISIPFVDGYGISRHRCIIQKSTGEVILNSINHKCYVIGNFIQIIHNGESQFLNTLTGEIGPLCITVPVDQTGKINFKNINDINNFLSVNPQLSLSSGKDDLNPISKKLIPRSKKDD